MGRYKVGDEVRVRSDLTVGRFYGGISFVSGMKSLCGKVVSISLAGQNGYKVNDMYWYWSEEMFDPAKRKIEVLIDGNTTVTVKENDFVGIAKCHPEDDFDLMTGIRLAVERMEVSKAWPQRGGTCFHILGGINDGRFAVTTSMYLPNFKNAIGKFVFPTKEEAQKMADRLNKILQ